MPAIIEQAQLTPDEQQAIASAVSNDATDIAVKQIRSALKANAKTAIDGAKSGRLDTRQVTQAQHEISARITLLEALQLDELGDVLQQHYRARDVLNACAQHLNHHRH